MNYFSISQCLRLIYQIFIPVLMVERCAFVAS